MLRHSRNQRARFPRPEEASLRNAPAPLRVAYLMSRFPKLTETFILYEILAIEALGVPVEIYPLLHEREQVLHRAAEELVRQAHFRPFLSLAILRAHAYFLWRQPINYFKTLFEALRGTFRSPRYFAGAVVYFPKAVRFAYEMAQKRVDHLHAHFANHPAMVALIIHRLTGIPFSFTAHGSDLQVDQAMLGRKVAAAQTVISVSEYNKELIVAECGEESRRKIRVVHCGVDPTAFERRRSRGAEPFTIVCVASFEEVKGHKYLIEACRVLRQRGVDFVCHLVGDGSLRNTLRQQTKQLGLSGRIKFHGALRRSQVATLVGEADVLALASVPTRDGRREGIPVALMEAMACGLPVVSSAIGGIPELVESDRTGILAPPRDALKLASALETLAGDPELRNRMGAAGREKVLREFNLQRNAEKLLECFLGTDKKAEEPYRLARRSERDEAQPVREFSQQL
jgi:glycosyltransferase involved in cell wall biosynthesis